MGTTDFSEDYRSVIEALTDEEMVDTYLQREGYDEKYVALLVDALRARGLPPEELTSGEVAHALLASRKSDEELHAIYTSTTEYSSEWRSLAEAEATRRGLTVDAIAREKERALFEAGVPGKHVIAGFVFCFLGGIIGLIIGIDYVFSAKSNADGEQFYKYDKATRSAGKWMLALLAVVVTITIIARIID
jgi:hypothetical protein